MSGDLLPGFRRDHFDAPDARIAYRAAGAGPPLLLLHGYPQTHVCWHRVAPALAEGFTVVLPDLRGYGDSAGPGPQAGAQAYSKRAMAADVVALMRHLGFADFAVAGHDRGGRVAYRLALDHPDRVRRLAVLDIVPTLEMWSRWDRALALNTYHWTFLAQRAGIPERMIGADPGFYLRHLLESWAGEPSAFDVGALAAYEEAFARPEVIRATCEDYRAGAGVDVEHDRADRDAGRRIACPLLVLYGARGLAAEAASPVEIWRDWAGDVRGRALDCGHFLMEERPDQTLAALRAFFAPA